MKQLLLVFLTAICLTGYGQKDKAEELRAKGNLEGAIRAYKQAYLENPDDSKNTYKLASTIALLYQLPDSAFHYLSIALEGDSTLWVLADTDMISLSEDKRWKTIEDQQMQKYQAANGPMEEPEYAKELLRVIMKDQSLDYYIDLAKDHFMKNGFIPHWYYPLGKMKSDIGAGNFEKMQSLLSQYGWPTYSKVGTLAADALLLTINHHESDDIRKMFISQIEKACRAGEGSCMEFAKIQDRILVNDNKPQIYGMQFRYNAKRELEPFPIENPEYVDKRRAEIGLEPLKVYLKRKIGYDWDVKQKHK